MNNMSFFSSVGSFIVLLFSSLLFCFITLLGSSFCIFFISILGVIASTTTAASIPSIWFILSLISLLSLLSILRLFVFGHGIKKIISFIFFRINKYFIIQYNFRNILSFKCLLYNLFIKR